ncbi:hypothetical protein N7448_008678 [Penicillium atrosanguineum]|nr:hypothetical protein N7448_008678 [Penicillium atrosanguineum]KAJ5148107.1 hypothetical protein N7526_001459 [Penicillium atrosanguineum]
MKITKNLMLLAVCAVTASAVAVPDNDIADECRSLGGAMSIQAHELPEGVSASDVRKCVEHPLGRERYFEDASLAPFNEEQKKNSTQFETRDPLDERAADACYTAAPYGCSKGYCWKSCGSNGEWCWTANKAGLGSWITCSKYQDCGTTTYACGIGGASGGCSC